MENNELFLTKTPALTHPGELYTLGPLRLPVPSAIRPLHRVYASGGLTVSNIYKTQCYSHTTAFGLTAGLATRGSFGSTYIVCPVSSPFWWH